MRAPATLALFLTVFPVATSTPAATVDSYEISYLYVDANEDRASGGHAAIRVADEVFHFQYDRGLMRLDRDEWSDFELDYRGFQNRTLHVSRVAVSNDTKARLQAAFRQHHLSRTLQIELLDAAVADEALVAKLIDSERPAVSLPGLGFFASRAEDGATTASRRLASLRAAIEADPRSTPLDDTSRALNAALQDLPVRPLDLSSVDFEPGSFPSPRYAFNQRYADLIAGIRAIEILNHPKTSLLGETILGIKAIRERCACHVIITGCIYVAQPGGKIQGCAKIEKRSATFVGVVNVDHK